MSEPQLTPKAPNSARWTLWVVMGLLVVAIIIFLGAFLDAESMQAHHLAMMGGGTGDVTPSTSSEDLEARVSALLENADAAHGDALIDELGCGVCHRAGAGRVAPGFEGIAQRASSRIPDLSAAAYIYQSIAYPEFYVVEGYTPAMPQNYLVTLSESELADIIAYLLTEDAR